MYYLGEGGAQLAGCEMHECFDSRHVPVLAVRDDPAAWRAQTPRGLVQVSCGLAWDGNPISLARP